MLQSVLPQRLQCALVLSGVDYIIRVVLSGWYAPALNRCRAEWRWQRVNGGEAESESSVSLYLTGWEEYQQVDAPANNRKVFESISTLAVSRFQHTKPGQTEGCQGLLVLFAFCAA